jgi:PAS domain S-box-containing protein
MASDSIPPKPRLNAFRLGALFRIGALVLVISILAAYVSGMAVIHANEMIGREQALTNLLQETLSTVKDAETGQRGYLLTGEDRYAQPYVLAKSRIHEELAQLETMSGRNGLPKGDIDKLATLIRQKLAELDHTLSLRRDGNLEAAVTRVKTNIGQQLMEEIRAELEREKRRADRLTVVRTALFVVLALANIGFLFWAYRRISHEIRRTELAAEETKRQKELLRVTLASIGDAVIVTDERGNITFLNAIAESLTGWTDAEAQGLACAKVFNIINETTRQQVESPVEKVIRLGAIVGLANHTLLVRKDGTEVPIDDSGAPIRDANGVLRGTVLVFRDFSEYKKSEKELRQAKEEAEAANIAKDNFLATLSHELRTPLTPVSGILSAWETDRKVPPELLPEVQLMRRNVDLEARLIDDLLDLTRIVRGKLSLNLEVADVHDLINAVVTMYQSEAHAKRLKLLVQLNAEKHFVYADPARLQQVVLNLLKNAIKFTPEGGLIELKTSNEGGTVEVVVHDNGIGMSPVTLDKLFQPFEQGTDEVVKRYGGLGLGLAISKTLVNAQGGTIAADSPGLGMGSTISVSLPCVNAPDCKPAPSQPKVEHSQAPLEILFVEDHADTARVMSNLLGSFGHKITVRHSVKEATDAFSAGRFDLLLSDIGLPDGTGIDLIKAIRKQSNLPAIALTGFGMEEDVAACLEAGFNAHLTKPVNLQKLELMIQQLNPKKVA